MVQTKLTDDELILRHVVIDPAIRSRSDARVKRTGTHIWVLVGQYLEMGEDPQVMIDGYNLSAEEAEAVLAYYRRFQAYIDARILLDNDFIDDPDELEPRGLLPD